MDEEVMAMRIIAETDRFQALMDDIGTRISSGNFSPELLLHFMTRLSRVVRAARDEELMGEDVPYYGS